jgi:SAM-dependent methyltransferase
LVLNSYRSLCTQVYEIDKPTAPADALEFLLHYAREAKGPILEPMSGSGRYLVPLLEAGFDVDGIDASPAMMAVCRQKCDELGVRTNLFEGFIQEVELSRQYGLAIIPAGSFTLITDPRDALVCLKKLFDCLLPGAKLVLEAGQVRGTESSSWPWGGRWWNRPDGGKIILSWMGRYDACTGIVHSIHRYELVVDGKLVETEFEDFDTRAYARDEMIGLLEEAGFRDVKMYRAYAFDEPRETDEDAVYECTRP